MIELLEINASKVINLLDRRVGIIEPEWLNDPDCDDRQLEMDVQFTWAGLLDGRVRVGVTLTETSIYAWYQINYSYVKHYNYTLSYTV